MKKFYIAFTMFVVLGMVLSACGGTATADNKLEEILARGTLIVSTDPAYPPQSELVEGGARAADTKCASDQHTSSELTGFDIDVAVAIAEKLGVEACFVTPDWTLITGGNWANRWDISIGSMTITPERMSKLYFTQPYYTTPAAFYVHVDNTTYTDPAQLAGKKIGACTGCTYDAYLAGTLTIPGETFDYVVADPEFVGYETDLNALQDLQLGDGVRLDAVLTAQPTGAGVIADGFPLKQLGEPVYFEYLAGAIDIASTPDPAPFVQKITEIILELHADGTLLQLSQEYYGLDLTSAAGLFDWEMLDQFK
ncbi:MAG TPA: transporter substrate-binding domain-containing protein [Anaerolineales bacterium]|nr:transporter substrate-binding domain-containing protein [Anaerolineales bacterium]